MSNVFFIGDLHIDHLGIMKFGQRDFDTIHDHNEALIENWNSVVRKKHDMVWVMGDVSMSLSGLTCLNLMNGRKNLIMGNHDVFPIKEYLRYFDEVKGAWKYKGMILTHIPIHPNELYGRVNVHGHVHMEEKYFVDKRYINVCADFINLTPVSLDWVIERKEKAYKE